MCGKLSSPQVNIGEALDEESFEDLVKNRAGKDEVAVIGHGWNSSQAETFVWTGSVEEFIETWEVD